MNVPEIRFKEFCDYYSDILLEKCLSVSNKKNNKLEYKKEDALSVSDEFGVVNQIEHLGRSYTGYNISTYKILNKGQIVYTKSPLKLKPFGIIKVNKNKPGIVSVLYIIRKSKFPQNPKRSVRFSGKRTKRSVQKRKARNTQKAETKVL